MPQLQGGAPTDAMGLYGDPDYWDKLTPANMFGLTPGPSNVRAAGQSLPLTTTTGGDHLMQWWHPDSPTMWAVVLIAATGVLIAGASFRVRGGLGKTSASAGASVGREK